MGLWAGGVCVPVDHALAAIQPTFFQAPSYLAEFRGGEWRIAEYKNALYDGGSTYIRSARIPLVGLAECDEYQPFYDGLSVGWMIGLSLVAAWGVRRMMRYR